MKFSVYPVVALCLFFVGCEAILSPEGWPVTGSARPAAVKHMVEHVKFTGDSQTLTEQEKVLLTFLDSPQNVADALGKKNRAGAHQWSTSEIYRVEPGKSISVLCENGYSQKALYFRYIESKKTWYKVSNLEQPDARGIPAVTVQ